MSYTGTTIRDAEGRRRDPMPQIHARMAGGRRRAARDRRRAERRRRPRARAQPARRPARVKVVWQRELIRFCRDRLRIITSLVQPLLFLFVLGTGLVADRRAGTHGVDPASTFIFPGVLCMAVMFTAMFSAASIVWDREFGFLREMLVAPVRRGSIVLGKCFGGATVAGFQGLIVIALAGARHVPYAPALILERLRAAAAARVHDHRLRRDGRRRGSRRCSRSWR